MLVLARFMLLFVCLLAIHNVRSATVMVVHRKHSGNLRYNRLAWGSSRGYCGPILMTKCHEIAYKCRISLLSKRSVSNWQIALSNKAKLRRSRRKSRYRVGCKRCRRLCY